MPETAVESFAGVANPWALGRLAAGRAGARPRLGRRHRLARSPRRWSATEGRVTGIDMTPEMLAKARAAAAEMGATNVEFVEGEAEQLPFPDASFDVVISNGVIDLIPDKDAVFAELFRVLAPGRAHPDRRRDDPEPGQRGRPAQHRPLDRLNCRGAAGSSVREAPRTARLRADRDRPARRHLRPLEVRGHAPQGAEVRRPRHDPQGVQAEHLR